MKQQSVTGLLPVLLASIWLLPPSGSAMAATPACGSSITADTTFDSDLVCPGTALFFNSTSNNVTLDCAGFGITTTSQRAISGGSASGITITNCAITTNHFEGRGMVLTRITNSTISNNVITTTGDSSRAIHLRTDSNSNQITGNTVHTSGASSVGIRLESSTNNNVITDNHFRADASYAFSIRSSSGNRLSGNTLESAEGFLANNQYSLQNGGLAVDAAGNIHAVENNWGSSAGNGLGNGEATALFQVDPVTGLGHSVVPLLLSGSNVGFGFDSLEILPINGRYLATPGADLGSSQLYEINPASGEVTPLTLTNAAPPNNVVGDINGLESTGPSGLLATTNRGELASIDLNAMTMTLIGGQSTGWTGIATHPTSGRTYAVSRRRNEASNTSHLYEIDVGTGAIIAEIGDTGSYSVSDIDFSPDGTLYGNYGLMTINVNTGLATLIGEGWFGGDPLEPLSANNRFEDTVLRTQHGDIRFNDSINLPSDPETLLSADTVQISANRARIDSTALPFLDQPARITLKGLTGDDRTLLVDDNEDGDYEECPEDRCTEVSFDNGNLVFDVTGFSAYSSEEDDGGGGAWPAWMLMLLATALGLRRRNLESRG